MYKTRFSDTEDTGARDIARAETERADIVARSCTAMKARINTFFHNVDYVVFESVETAPTWAPNWRDYLLTGAIPDPVEPATEEEGPAAELEIVGDEAALDPDETFEAEEAALVNAEVAEAAADEAPDTA